MTRRTVRDTEGTRYLLLKRSADASLVRHPETGERQHIPNDDLDTVDDATAADTVLRALPEPVVSLVTSVHDERSLALLLELDEEGPLSVRTLLSEYDFCESDLHGLLTELRAGGFVAETTVLGQRGYETTEVATDALDALRT
ncbi:hypothetical protein ACFQJ7_01105 [Halovenus rubra]|uniref:Transcriptional regulator n=2 Tax=Halovenus rubra TaxID=869890 RepID=A0ABD5X148_9EURY|nr:hypothetical protein [Halovenus rubra]